MKTQLISSMASFVLGTGATLVALSSWLGTSDLQAIKDSVQSYVVQSEEHSSALLGEYNVTVDQANAEIKDYQDALKQANDNISQLITAYEQQEFEHEIELKGQQSQAEQDLAELQQAYDEMVARVESDYESNVNYYIEQANAEINQANQDVLDTRVEVQEIIDNSIMSDIAENGERHQLDTTGSKEVTDISSIVPSEQQGE